jgi:DNA-binding PadR family transcriptional regulator
MPADFRRPRAVLYAISKLSGDSYMDVNGPALIAELDQDRVEIDEVGLYNLMHRLRDDGYISFHGGAGMSAEKMALIRLDERGRQEIEGWPAVPGTLTAPDVEALIAVFDQRGDTSPDPTESGKAKAVARGLRDLGVGVTGPMLVAWLKSIGGAP